MLPTCNPLASHALNMEHYRLICFCGVLKDVFSIGIFTPSDELAKEVAAASEVSGEKFWRLPLEESYWESMKSGVADMVNTGGRQGGSITAALFLKQVHFCLFCFCFWHA